MSVLVWPAAFTCFAACTAARAPSHDEQVRESCRATATVVEKFRLGNSLAFNNQALSGSDETIEIRSLNPTRLADCLRANGVSDVELSAELAHAHRKNDCRNQAMAAVPASGGSGRGAVEIVFDAARYDACIAGER